MKPIAVSLLLLAGLAPCAHAIVWDEAINGDLSGSNTAPTPITFDLGVNTIKGTMGGDPGDGIPLDRDFFTVTVGPNQAITSINVLAFGAARSFYAIGPGTSIDITSAANHLSNVIISGTGEILPTLAAGAFNGGTGLSNPIGPGTYIFWLQEVSSVVPYEMAYTLTSTAPAKAVPFLPAGLLIAAAVACGAFGMRALRGRVTA